jgi:hypothetical protein
MINLKRSSTGHVSITLPEPPANGRQRALALLGLLPVAFVNGQTHCVNTQRPVPVRYKRPRTLNTTNTQVH